MNRRDALKSTATFAAATGGLPTSSPETLRTRTLAATPPRGPYIDTQDGQSLFYKDWGSGRPKPGKSR